MMVFNDKLLKLNSSTYTESIRVCCKPQGLHKIALELNMLSKAKFFIPDMELEYDSIQVSLIVSLLVGMHWFLHVQTKL